MKNPPLLRLLLLSLALGLAACESSLDIDLATVNRPVDAERISVRIEAVELQDEEGGTYRIETDDRLVDLLDFQGSELLSLVGGEEVPSARYRKLRLIFDERDAEIQTDDGEFPIRISDLQPGADMDIRLSDDEDETENLLAVLDLRFSFSRQTQPDNLYRLRQVATAGRSGDLGGLQGSVDEDYVQGGACAGSEEEGFAMYLYRGDRRNQLSDYAADVTDSPLVSASVVRAGDEGDFSYRFRGLPQGQYTVAYTCKAELDDPFTRENTLVFRDAFLVDVEEGGTATRDF
jgi:hypothetical protein